MKKIITLSAILLLCFMAHTLYAQSNDKRYKMQMTINHSGKTIQVDVNSASFGIMRDNTVESPVESKKTTSATAVASRRNATYLSLNLKKIDENLLQLFSKKGTRFDGSVILTDTYGKNKPREITFSNALLESYSDLFQDSYSEEYSPANISISCEKFAVNGVEIEQ